MSILSADSINTALCASLEAVIGVPKSRLSATTKIQSDLHMQSIDIVDLLFELESRLQTGVDLTGFFRSGSTGGSFAFDMELQEIVAYVLRVTQ